MDRQAIWLFPRSLLSSRAWALCRSARSSCLYGCSLPLSHMSRGFALSRLWSAPS